MLSARSSSLRREALRRRKQKPKRTMMEIYYDILTGIEQERAVSRTVKRTRVQQHSNLSYDKFSRYLQDMSQRGLVQLNPLSITEKGREFLHDYGRIRHFMSEIGSKFFKSSPGPKYGPADFVASLPPGHHSVVLPQRPPESFGDLRKGVHEMTKGMKPPFRFFGNFVRVTNPKELQVHLRIEKLAHDRFDELGISLLAWYDLKTVPQSFRREFVGQIIERHSRVIYASDPSKAFGFDSSLLGHEA